MFKNRNLVIATKHGKELVIAPILEKELGVKCFLPLNFDSDELGTFTGEIEREDDPITTARKKCLKAMELTNSDLAVASEGSFGPHPTLFFINADDEFLLFIDKKNGLEIIARELNTETNFKGALINSEKQLLEFANVVSFPSHGIIIRDAQEGFKEIEKGITDWELLKNTFDYFLKKHNQAYLETDMRALYNPSRMKVIEIAATKLATKINSLCPICKTPGFSISDLKKGLPCSSCNFPTKSTLYAIYTCKNCSYSVQEKFPNKKLTEDPMFCDVCNP
jgi:hypothetical protein